jgi:streptogramin lyase
MHDRKTGRRVIASLVLIVLLGATVSALLAQAASATAAQITFYGSGAIQTNSKPYSIIAGPGGDMWFSENNGTRLAKITTSGVVTEIGGYVNGPDGLAFGPDGNIWVCENVGNKIARETTSGVVTHFSTGITANCRPKGICLGPDGNMWFCESNVARIGKITMAGVITEYPLPLGSQPYYIAVGPDGALWFTEYGSNSIGRITTSGAVTHAYVSAGSAPFGICAGPGDSMWFTESTAMKIGKVAMGGLVTEYGAGITSSWGRGIAYGSDGNIWWSENQHKGIAMMTPSGVVTEYQDIEASPGTMGMVLGPDDNIWFCCYASGEIGKVTISVPEHAWYLAEGTTAWGFHTNITIENPNATPVAARITYMPTGASSVTQDLMLAASSQTTVDPGSKLGQKDFSTKVEALDPMNAIAVDRTMTWTGQGAASPEAHSSIGVTSPATAWYLAEGSSAWGFECWLLVQNPNATDTTATFTYMIEGAAPKAVQHLVKAHSRATFNMADDIGAHDASVMITAPIPIIPERAMYRYNKREGHDSIGTTAAASDYYLAEGTSAWGFTTFVLVQNPNSSTVNVNVTYMTSGGPVSYPQFTMGANSRKTIRVNDSLANKDFSTKVHGSKPIIAERSMYWGAGSSLGEACHDSIGLAAPHSSFYLPDGQATPADGPTETWTLVQNPNSTAVSIRITYLRPNGTHNVTFADSIPANSRKTYNMGDKLEGRASIQVDCTTVGKKIMVERAMYFFGRGGGTDTIGGFRDLTL